MNFLVTSTMLENVCLQCTVFHLLFSERKHLLQKSQWVALCESNCLLTWNYTFKATSLILPDAPRNINMSHIWTNKLWNNNNTFMISKNELATLMLLSTLPTGIVALTSFCWTWLWGHFLSIRSLLSASESSCHYSWEQGAKNAMGRASTAPGLTVPPQSLKLLRLSFSTLLRLVRHRGEK